MDNKIYQKIFLWLFIGLLITFGGGFLLSLNENMVVKLTSIGILPIIILELIIAFLMGIRLGKMHPLSAKILYIVYSILTGITFSTLFLYYQLSSLMFIFLITAIIFAIMAILGFVTKINLSNFGFILLISLLVVIVVSILEILVFKNSMLDIIISGIGVLIFCGFVAYDMQKIKVMQLIIGDEKAAIFGAFQLYLDFINIFIDLLKIFGNLKDND